MNAISINTSAIRQFDGLYSLNDLHKLSGGESKHKPLNFLRAQQTQDLINEINHCSDMRRAVKTINGGDKKGSYGCKEIVYAYAMWISPAFMLAVIRAYDKLVAPAKPALALPSQKLHVRRLVEAKAKEIGGAKGDYGLVWSKVHNVCGCNKLDEMTPAMYYKACDYFNAVPVTGEQSLSLTHDVIDTNMQVIPKLKSDEYYRHGKVWKINQKCTDRAYGDDVVLVPFDPKRNGMYYTLVENGMVSNMKAVAFHETDIGRNFAIA